MIQPAFGIGRSESRAKCKSETNRIILTMYLQDHRVEPGYSKMNWIPGFYPIMLGVPVKPDMFGTINS